MSWTFVIIWVDKFCFSHLFGCIITFVLIFYLDPPLLITPYSHISTPSTQINLTLVTHALGRHSLTTWWFLRCCNIIAHESLFRAKSQLYKHIHTMNKNIYTIWKIMSSLGLNITIIDSMIEIKRRNKYISINLTKRLMLTWSTN